MVKNPPASAGDARDMGSIPGWENSMDRRALGATVRGVAKSWVQLSDWAHKS